MFEYLMPVLVMRSFPSTLLAQTYQGAVRRHRSLRRRAPGALGRERERLQRARPPPHLPVPGLRRARPRAQARAGPRSGGRALCLRCSPRWWIRSRRSPTSRSSSGSARSGPTASATRSTTPGPTPSRHYAVVSTYMAHHIGMSLVALTNVLCAGLWQRRFHADPLVRSAELLLHERIPRRLVLQEPQARPAGRGAARARSWSSRRCGAWTRPTRPQPHVALLGHLPYTIMVSHCGAGYSRYEELAVTRWRADGTRDATGQFCYLKDLSTGRVWSAATSRSARPPTGIGPISPPTGSPSTAPTATSRPAPRSRSCRRTRRRCGG